MADYLAVGVAAAALLISLWQVVGAARAQRLRLLLGDRIAVAFQADQIAAGRARFVSKSVVRALEPSDRARLQIYRALDEMNRRQRDCARDFRATLIIATIRYATVPRADASSGESAVDLTNFTKRRDQLDAALPWIKT
ncbi:hypothetical protein AB0H36_11705 [Kribbella sp. NPDC050820]|uniref:hypothetical protein n=1 Tax=Kribbella sp. NPDC050820 TaxID=3155408 RepID=UPI0033F366DB